VTPSAAAGSTRASLVISTGGRVRIDVRQAGIETLVREHGAWPTRDVRAVSSGSPRTGGEVVCLARFSACSGVFVSAFPPHSEHPPGPAAVVPSLHAQRQALGLHPFSEPLSLVDTNLDAGPIVLQAVVPVFTDDSEDTRSARILAEEHRIYPEAIGKILEANWRLEGRRLVFG
jgi:phosphoribosylglycinamide formyltransferase-1